MVIWNVSSMLWYPQNGSASSAVALDTLHVDQVFIVHTVRSEIMPLHKWDSDQSSPWCEELLYSKVGHVF